MSRPTRTCSRTCSTRRCSSITRSTAERSATRPRSRRRTSSTGCSRARRASVEIERGKTLIMRFLTMGEVSEDGTRTVFFELNGQPRAVERRRPLGSATVKRHPKADPDNATHIAAPMPGKVSTVAVTHRPGGEEGRTAAVHRGDEDGDGRLQPARRQGRRGSRRRRVSRRSARPAARAQGLTGSGIRDRDQRRGPFRSTSRQFASWSVIPDPGSLLDPFTWHPRCW